MVELFYGSLGIMIGSLNRGLILYRKKWLDEYIAEVASIGVKNRRQK